MTHKEFYIWLEGFMTNRDWTDIKQSDIETIQGKMKELKDAENTFPRISRTTVPSPFNPVIMPLKNDDDPYKPPFEVTC
jgi:hypothetical protein